MSHYNQPQNPAHQYNTAGTTPQYNAYQTAQQYPYYPNQNTYLRGWFDYKNPAYVKGAVVGAALAFVLANPTVKKALVKGVVGAWGSLQGGVEELKEQIRDVQAEQGVAPDGE
jgi:hypothetical protein